LKNDPVVQLKWIDELKTSSDDKKCLKAFIKTKALVLLLQEVDKLKSQVASPSQDANPSQIASSSVRTMA
jgi:hypothetical protein